MFRRRFGLKAKVKLPCEFCAKEFFLRKVLTEHIRKLLFLPYCFSNTVVAVDLWYLWLHGNFEEFIPRKTKQTAASTMGYSEHVKYAKKKTSDDVQSLTMPPGSAHRQDSEET